MDQAQSLGARKVVRKIFRKFTHRLAMLLVFMPHFHLSAATAKTNQKSNGDKSEAWSKTLRKRLVEIEESNPGTFGLYVKDLKSGEEFSFHAEDAWYVASGVKLPVALTVLRQIEEGKFTLDTKIKISADDFVDGAGFTNSHKPGSELSVSYLLGQMMVHSDNTASDLLIRLVGLDEINALVQDLTTEGFGPITTLSDVRRFAYSGFSPAASQLTNHDIRSLKAIPNEKKRIAELAKLLKLKIKELRARNVNDAFNMYYARKMNSATLVSYGKILEKLAEGQVLDESRTALLTDIMASAETGKERIKKGLPTNVVFAHKTGTQHARICDLGFAWNETDAGRKIVIAACVRDIASLAKSEKVLKEVGQAISSSGLF